jgi:hypothetical protein
LLAGWLAGGCRIPTGVGTVERVKMTVRIIRNIGGFYDLEIPGKFGEKNYFFWGPGYLKFVKQVGDRENWEEFGMYG